MEWRKKKIGERKRREKGHKGGGRYLHNNEFNIYIYMHDKLISIFKNISTFKLKVESLV